MSEMGDKLKELQFPFKLAVELLGVAKFALVLQKARQTSADAAASEQGVAPPPPGDTSSTSSDGDPPSLASCLPSAAVSSEKKTEMSAAATSKHEVTVSLSLSLFLIPRP